MTFSTLCVIDIRQIWDIKDMDKSVSRLDRAYRKILISKFFTKGWGETSHILTLHRLRKLIRNRETCYKLIPENYPITIINKQMRKDCQIIEGTFLSPFYCLAPELVPKESRRAYFQMILPLKWRDEYRPVCIHLAGTGDHHFWRRRHFMGRPLLKFGISSLILEAPYYGSRKPRSQVRSNLQYVSDIFVMGGCIILESLALLKWCESMGLGPAGVSGISMGGHMASLVASNWPKSLVLVPCLSWSTGSTVFTEGVMSDSIDWDMLQMQYLSNDILREELSKNCKIVDPFILALNNQDQLLCALVNPQSKKKRRTLPYEFLNTVSTYLHRKQTRRNFSVSVSPAIGSIDKRGRNCEALHFMRSLMDEYTHLKNFSIPYDTSLIIAVCAKSDGYVPRLGISKLEDIWPGITVKYINSGHVGACIWHRKMFQECINEAFERAKQKLPPPLPIIQ